MLFASFDCSKTRNYLLRRRHAIFEEKKQFCYFLTWFEISKNSFHFFLVSETCFSILTLRSLNNSPLRNFCLYPAKTYLPFLTQIGIWNGSYSHILHFKGLFFNHDFEDTNKKKFMVGCRVTFIPNFTTLLQYSTKKWTLGKHPKNICIKFHWILTIFRYGKKGNLGCHFIFLYISKLSLRR